MKELYVPAKIADSEYYVPDGYKLPEPEPLSPAAVLEAKVQEAFLESLFDDDDDYR